MTQQSDRPVESDPRVPVPSREGRPETSAGPGSRPDPAGPGRPPAAPGPNGGSRPAGPGSAAARRRDAAGALAVAAALLVGACGGGGGEAGSGGEGAAGGPGAAGGTPVETAVARRDTLSSTVRAVGTLEADARVEVKPELDGHVTSIEFREGEPVREGEVLVRLDQNKLRAQAQAARAAVKRARATASNLERRLARNDSLLASGAISEQAYDDLQAEYESAEAALDEAVANRELAEQQLEDATIRAPFDGRTGARDFDLGDYVQVGETLFTMVDDDPLEVEFSVPERHLGRLRTGSPVRVSVRSDPGRPVRGEVSFVSPYVDASNRAVQLKARVPNPASELRAGQFASVELELDQRAGVVIPEAAVVSRQQQNVVFVVRDGNAAARSVQLGQRRSGVVEVRTGIQAGDTVVVAGHQRLADGAAVSRVGDGDGGEGAPGEDPPGADDGTAAPGTDESGAGGPGADDAGGEG